MAQITAGLVKELRERTGAGMMDCKKALAATEGDMDKAIDFLREKGLAAAAKKAGDDAAAAAIANLLMVLYKVVEGCLQRSATLCAVDRCVVLLLCRCRDNKHQCQHQ